MKDQRIYCVDILERIERIERFTVDGPEAFLESELIQDGVIRNFEVIGEVVKRLDATLTQPYPDVAWHDIAGFRDFLIHHYEKIMLPKVWEIVEEDLPPLKTAIEAILRDLDS